MNEVAKKAVRALLETSRRLQKLNSVIESEPIGGVIDDMGKIVHYLYDIELSAHECADGFFETIYEYQTDGIDINECLDCLEEFRNYVPEDKKVR